MPPLSDNSEKPIRIVLLDPFVLIRSGLRLLIERQPGFCVVGEAGDLIEGLEIVACQQPDIVLIDSTLAGNPSLKGIPRLIQLSSQARIILVTVAADSKANLLAVQDGVLGVVFKTQSPEILLKAIEKVHGGEVWIERSMMAHLITNLSQVHQAARPDPEKECIALLSVREREVIRLIGQGLKNQQIAAQLCISETTVRHHLTSIYSKLGVSDRLELLVFAHRCDLI